MRPDPSDSGTRGGDMYTPREIAVAAGVPIAEVLAALNGVDGYVPHADAVRLGRLLVSARRPRQSPRGTFRSFGFAASTGLHVAFAALAFLLLTRRALGPIDPVFHLDQHADPMRL